MVVTDSVSRELQAAASSVGISSANSPTLRWGGLLNAVDEQVDEQYVVAIELIYEGYLFHYGVSRLNAAAGLDREAALLAGDYYYARGLHVVASRGDVGSVDVLARLMAACAYLRNVNAPKSDDDALWAYAVGALAALRQGTQTASATRVFDELEAAWAGSRAVDVRAVVRSAGAALRVPRPAPLAAELEGPRSPSATLAEPLAALLTN